MTPASRTIATAVVSSAAVVGMAFTATSASAHPTTGGDSHNHGQHVTLAQAKKFALHGLAFELKVLDRFEGIADADSYVGTAAQQHAISLANKQEARDRSAETKVSAATTKDQVEQALRAAHGSWQGKHDSRNGAGHATLALQKTAAQLMLDGKRAFVVQHAVSAGKAKPETAMRSIAKTKSAVDAAKTEKQLQQALGRDCGGPHGH